MVAPLVGAAASATATSSTHWFPQAVTGGVTGILAANAIQKGIDGPKAAASASAPAAAPLASTKNAQLGTINMINDGNSDNIMMNYSPVSDSPGAFSAGSTITDDHSTTTNNENVDSLFDHLLGRDEGNTVTVDETADDTWRRDDLESSAITHADVVESVKEMCENPEGIFHDEFKYTADQILTKEEIDEQIEELVEIINILETYKVHI